MKIGDVFLGALPVLLGLAIFGFTANALRGNSFVKQIINGFDG